MSHSDKMKLLSMRLETHRKKLREAEAFAKAFAEVFPKKIQA